MNTPLIEINNLSIEYPVFGVRNLSLKNRLLQSVVGGTLFKDSNNLLTVKALEDISFKLFPGDRVALIGHNGSGKSTLLKVIAGIYAPTSGSIRIYGSITTMLDITIGLNNDSTGLENIIISGLLMGLSKKKIEELKDEIIDFSGLSDFIHLPLRTYSTGMSMRLAFSIASTITSEIILIDEWISVGDSEFSLKVRNRLNDMIINSKIMVMASHDLDLCRKICNKFIHLENGRITGIDE